MICLVDACMPEFLDSFAEEIELKKSYLRDLITKGVSNPLDPDIEFLMLRNWHNLPTFNIDLDGYSPKAIAVDGSLAKRLLSGGCVLYIVRSMAFFGGKRFRRLEFDILTSRAGAIDVSRYVSRRSEYFEHMVAIDALESGVDADFLLLDGSFHSRLMAVPQDIPFEGRRRFMIDYFNMFCKLLNTCRLKGVIPVGVSKDSRVTILRDYFLSNLLSEELGNLQPSPEDYAEINRTFQSILHRRRGQRVKRFIRLESNYGVGRLARVMQILLEAKTLRSDHQMILRYTKGVGYSTPLELGAYGRGPELLDRYEREPREYVAKYFPEAIDEAEDPKEFMEEATEVLSRIPSLSTIVSFHIRLDERDTPLRIDVPSWAFGVNRTLKDLHGFAPLKDLDPSKIINMLRNLFGGVRHYNILLTTVDNDVRLRRNIVDETYLPILEKSLGLQLPIRPVRGYRRGWYVS
ncbi:DNA double-strand break repair nuclease NurA [Candidatus Bathyarchaeota archaeon]|nr:DNA double-strand break repair nuclease NurA [Candidatus Bathyarchaeota archaeon]